MALDTPENREKLTKLFSGLNDENFTIKSRLTPGYNCIAWAMGFDDRWVDCFPDDSVARKKWWPEGVDRDFRPETLVRAFEKMGFVKCDDDTIESDYDKVALYKVSPLVDSSTGVIIAEEGWTHAARVIGNNCYHSKMGGLFDIHHYAGNIFEGSLYGVVYQFMKRRKEDRLITENIKKSVPGITIPDNILNIINQKMSKA